MKPEEIQAEWDAFIDYPEGSGKLYVTTTSALIFARSIVGMAEKRERDRLRTQNQALVETLKDATDEIESWGAYASEYFQEKHDLAGNVAKFRAIAQAEGGV